MLFECKKCKNKTDEAENIYRLVLDRPADPNAEKVIYFQERLCHTCKN